MTTAAALLREVGLRADGPVPFGRPVAATGPGIYLIELPEPRATAPLELTRVGKWLERVPELRLDGRRPSSRALQARVAAFWLPDQTVLYAGATDASIGRRVAALERQVPGERRPHADGHWLHLLADLRPARVWWADTDAAEEYLDGLLDAFAAGVSAEALAGLPDREIVLPWAVGRRPTGERRSTGITGSVLPAEPAPPEAERRIIDLPPGDADGVAPPEAPSSARAVRPASAAAGAAGASSRRREAAGAATPGTTAPAPAGADAPPGTPARSRRVRQKPHPSTVQPQTLTADGLLRLQAEREELVSVRRPDVVARIRSARELGDLRENAEYQSAREEQSFLEGRVQAIDAILRTAVVAEAPADGGTAADGPPRARLGSTVTLEHDGESMTLTLVGPAEASLADGRVSIVSPVGQAVLGHRAGEDAHVKTPRGQLVYRVTDVSG